MSSDELFEAVSHPQRIEIVKTLAKNPLRFADLKRELNLKSSGLLDFYLKKLYDLITTNDDGCYALTDRGFAALATIESAAGYYSIRSAHKRSFFLSLIVGILGNALAFWVVNQTANYVIWYMIVLPITIGWLVFYAYWTFFKRRVHLRD